MTTLVPSARRYEASVQSQTGGLEGSREVTFSPTPLPETALLDAACEAAARGYVAQVQRMTFGLIRGVDRPKGGQAFKVLGIGPAMLKFGQVRRLGPGEYALPVEGGLLAKRAAGHLVFRWTSDAHGERFETAVEGFYPRLVGPWGTWFGRTFYRLTQQVAHRWVMRGFHDYIERERVKLLGLDEAPPAPM